MTNQATLNTLNDITEIVDADYQSGSPLFSGRNYNGSDAYYVNRWNEQVIVLRTDDNVIRVAVQNEVGTTESEAAFNNAPAAAIAAYVLRLLEDEDS